MIKHKLCPSALGLSLGILWGVIVFIVGLIAHFANYGADFVHSVGVLYVGYAPSVVGSLIGGVIGFVDAFICGYIIAWLYNLIAHCGCRKTEGENKIT